MRLLDIPPVHAVRSSFRWKLLLALVGSVAVLALVTLIVVQRETDRQIELATVTAERRARDAFNDLQEYNRAQLSQLSSVFTQSVQAAAALEGALESHDVETLAQDVDYEFEARRVPHPLVAFTDAYGEPVLALLHRSILPGADPADIEDLASRVLEDPWAEVRAYRVVADELFTVETMLLDLGRPIGTVTVGVPITDDDAARLGAVIGAEVCFVVDGRCVAGTEAARGRLESGLVALAGQPRNGEVSVDGARWRLVSDRLMSGDDAVWRVIAVPLDAVLAPFERVRRALLLGGIVALLLAIIIASLLGRGLTEPVHELVRATSRIGEGDYDTRVAVRSIDELGTLAGAFNDMAEDLALKQRYRGLLDKVVSRDIADELLKGDVVLGGEKREVTVLFADINGFTSITEGMEPARVIALLNECMELLSDAIEAEGGVVDKFIGDEVMGLFGAPVARPLDPLRAVRAALGMQHAMRDLNRVRADRGEAPLTLSLGLNTGDVMAGNMGSANRLNYTVLGDGVNMAARVEQLADNDQILMTEHTLLHVRDWVAVRELGARELRGFRRPVDVFELTGLLADAPEPDAARNTRGAAAPFATALAFALMLAVPAAASAQIMGELPTLERFHYSSPSGWFQAGLSGRLDVEAYLPDEEPAWIIPSTDPFVAPRARLFGDAFFGERMIASAELRLDGSEEPAAGELELRLDQLFVRFVPTDAVALQLGKFVSPLGAYPQRHHTQEDAFIRPPLPYDFRTVLNAHRAPQGPVDLLVWKDEPEYWRPTGAPVIWGAPYQWGVQAMGAIGRFDWRAAVMNSAPSSEPEEWGLDRGFDAPSWIAHVGIQVTPEVHTALAYNTGPWLTRNAAGVPPGEDPDDFDQRIWALSLTARRARTVVRAEAFHDTWGVPNVGYDVVDVSGYVEAEHGFTPAFTLAARWGMIHFLELQQYGSAGYEAWDYDTSRLQLAAGYRIAPNAGARAEVLLNRTDGPRDPKDNLLSFQLWWEF